MVPGKSITTLPMIKHTLSLRDVPRQFIPQKKSYDHRHNPRRILEKEVNPIVNIRLHHPTHSAGFKKLLLLLVCAGRRWIVRGCSAINNIRSHRSKPSDKWAAWSQRKQLALGFPSCCRWIALENISVGFPRDDSSPWKKGGKALRDRAKGAVRVLARISSQGREPLST